jgi:MFS family permease
VNPQSDDRVPPVVIQAGPTSRPEGLRTAFRDWAISMGYLRFCAPPRRRGRIRRQARTLTIWVFGLLASGILGAMLGEQLGYNWWLYGFFVGVFGFACVRLWLAPSPSSSKELTDRVTNLESKTDRHKQEIDAQMDVVSMRLSRLEEPVGPRPDTLGGILHDTLKKGS